jgi:hypothetical protein
MDAVEVWSEEGGGRVTEVEDAPFLVEEGVLLGAGEFLGVATGSTFFVGALVTEGVWAGAGFSCTGGVILGAAEFVPEVA